MVIKRVDPFQCGKVGGALYAFMGFLVGALFALMAGILGPSLSQVPFAGSFGIAALIVLPIIYGIIGFIMCVIMAAVYNLIAKWVGGLQIEVE